MRQWNPQDLLSASVSITFSKRFFKKRRPISVPSWVRESIRGLWEHPLHAGGFILAVAVLTNGFFLILLGRGLSSLGLLGRISFFILGVLGIGNKGDWKSIRDSSLLFRGFLKLLSIFR